jgi:hypothetical protein
MNAVEVPVIAADASAAEIALVGLEAGSPPSAAAASDLPLASGDRLFGHYICNQGKTDLTLIVEKVEGNELDVVFEFSFAGSPIKADGTREFDPAEGSFRMRGTYEARNKRLKLLHTDWIEQPPRYFMIDLEGRLDHGKYAGKIEGFSGCTTFEVSSKGP